MEIKRYLDINTNNIDIDQGIKPKDLSNNNKNNFFEILDETQKKIDISDKLIMDYVNGKDVPIHSIMISLEQARLSVQLISEVRNKIIESYNDLTRTAG